MSDLIVVAYPDTYRAAEVLATLRRLEMEYLVDLDDAVIVTKDQSGALKLHQGVNLTAAGAVNGMFLGLLVGTLFLFPFPFIAPLAWLGVTAATAGVGAATGAIAAHYADYGIDDEFVKNLSATMQPGSSALFVLVRKATPDKVIAEVSKFGGTILRTSLSQDAETKLQDALRTGQQNHALAS